VVPQGDNPVQVARDFAVMHKLDMDGLKSVLMHLKQRALVEGHMKRVFFQLPVLADKGETKQVLNLTIYEDSDPTDLSKKVGTVYGLNAGQVQKLGVTIEKEMVSRMKLRTEVDMKEYVRRQPPSRAAQAACSACSPRGPHPAHHGRLSLRAWACKRWWCARMRLRCALWGGSPATWPRWESP